jgi:FtsP/CotA-like multicopper oxidase with cupredoxin domain
MSLPTASCSRRRLLAGLAVTAVALPVRGWAQADEVRILRPQPGSAPLRGADAAPTAIWGYDGTVPGPLLRVKRGAEVKVRLVNGLAEPTSVHWHGVRAANAMDGAAPLTQKPIEPGQTFDYRFKAPDAGTFWYHPHVNAARQLDRGLYGLLIVDEAEQVAVDRDVALALDDWQLTPDGAIGEGGAAHFTVNSAPALDIAVKTNERVRLRLLNATSARMMSIRIDRHSARVMAIDGQPAEPFIARDSRVTFGPGNRIDFFVDMALTPGSAAAILLSTDKGEVPLARLVYDAGAPARAAPPPDPKPLPANALPERMDFRSAFRLDLPLGGTSSSYEGKPLFSVKRGRTAMLALVNKTTSAHSVHLHGHHFRLLDRLDDGWKPFWLDTGLVPPMDTWRIAFVADNPGKWVIQSRPLEQPEAGMATWFAVT